MILQRLHWHRAPNPFSESDVAASLSSAAWHVTTAAGSPLSPRRYTTGLMQDEAVQKILAAFRRGRGRGEPVDVFFRAGTGSGKSLVALNVAARTGRAIVSIPTVNLQVQYTEDYAGDSGRIRVMKPDGKPLRLESVMGRARYECPFEGGTAAEPHVCNRTTSKKESRWRKASKCKHWSPAMPLSSYDALEKQAEGDLREGYAPHEVAFLGSLRSRKLQWMGHEEAYVHVGRRGCPYFDAHAGFADADVVVLNNRKWEIETELGRKPRVDLEVFDECDHFLDGLFETQELTIEALTMIFERIEHPAKLLTLPEAALRDAGRLGDYDADAERLPDHLREGFNALRALVRRLKTFQKPEDFDDAKTWKALEAVPAMLKEFPRLARERMHTEFYGKPWSTIHVEATLDLGALTDQDENLVAKVKGFVEAQDSIVLAYDREGLKLAFSTFARPLAKLLEKSAPLRLWMSATLPEKEILEKVYGFRNPVVIDGEPRMQGTLRVATLPEEPPKITFKSWAETDTRKRFARALEATVKAIPKDERAITIVHGQGRLADVADVSPTAAWMLKEIEEDALAHERRLKEFVSGTGKSHLVSTRIARGVDFRHDLCRNVILLKDPLPNINDSKFQILRKSWPEPLFWSFVQDVADRQLVQMVGRGLRAPDDWVRLWALDSAIRARLDRVLRDRCLVVED